MVIRNLLILSILSIFSINAVNVPLKVQKRIEDAIDNSGFKKLLITRGELANPTQENEKKLLSRAYKFSGGKKVSAAKAKEQAENLTTILQDINVSGATQMGIEENCIPIFRNLGRYDQNQVLKIISNKININDLQSLCPTQVNQLLKATAK